MFSEFFRLIQVENTEKQNNFIYTGCYCELRSQPEYYAVYSHLTDTHQITLDKKKFAN